MAAPPQHCWSWADEYGHGNAAFGAAVFFAKHGDLALSFVETADAVPDDIYNSGFALISVESADLDCDLLTYDPFFHNDIESEFEDPFFEESSVLEQAECLAYRGDVPSYLMNIEPI